MTAQRLSQWIALRCRDPHFWRFLKVEGEQQAAEAVRARCNVKSRREFDTDPEAAQRLHETIRKPYITYIESHP